MRIGFGRSEAVPVGCVGEEERERFMRTGNNLRMRRPNKEEKLFEALRRQASASRGCREAIQPAGRDRRARRGGA